MTCENLVNPMAVDVLRPRLSWINEAGPHEHDQFQSAYQIQVASTREKLLRGKADMWNSGKQESQESVLVTYAGRPLSSDEDCYWRVRVWDQQGRKSKWSDVGQWHMGLLSSSDWRASWITSPSFSAGNSDESPLFRRDIVVSKPVKKAHAYVCGLGYFELYVDGKKVSDDVLVPNQTDYTYRPNLERTRVAIDNEFTGYRCLYLCYDLLPFFSEGNHALGVLLGNGFFHSGNAFAMPYGHPRLIVQLHLTYADGSEETILSDPSWRCKPSAIVMNGVYSGEHYDARLYDKDWCNPKSTTQAGWTPVVPCAPPDGILQAQMSSSDKVAETFRPQSMTCRPDGTLVVDFGEEISGWVHLRNLHGKAGQRLTINYLSESPNGENFYTMSGKDPEEYHPRFTWFVFRKVEISGLSQELSADDITAEAVNTDLRTTGMFACSDTLLSQIYRIWHRTLLDNVHGAIISDCPHRERAAYLGDGQVACDMVMSTFDARTLYAKWFSDMRLSQNPRTGFVPFGAPWQPGCGGGVPWSAAMILMPFEYYRHYGDRKVLADNYSSMLRLMDYFSQWVGEDGTMEQHYEAKNDMSYWCNLGEWCTPTSEIPANALVHTYYYWRCAEAMSAIARALDKEKDAFRYAQLSQNIWKSFHHRFYDDAKKSYGPAGSNLFALHMGVPETREKEVAATVCQELDDHDGHLYTGIFGTSIFFDVLASHSLEREALEAFTKRDFPSFGYWIAQGATTTWEQWDGGNSHCHPMFGGGLTWFYTWLAGIRPVDDRTLDIRPRLPEGITWVESSQENNYGIISVRAERTDRGIRVETNVPVGCQATVSAGRSQQVEHVASGRHVFLFAD
ncbi:MAG: family 78 glycoside hydrolase catalytic domain [Prevotella sp.]|nr:family 78 glycoside hydrolase catalytic domain [Prevotella sp.]